MMADKKTLSEKEIGSRVRDLKIELLKNPTKKGSIKREIARFLTMKQEDRRQEMGNDKVSETKLEDKK